MNDTKRNCPACGLAYTPMGKGQGCPHCLLKLAMPESDTGEAGNAEPRPPAGLKSRFFGGYEILEELARGGMGVVYRARQLSLNRQVALKMIQAGHLLSTEARLRFRVEIEAVAQLNHPNIVSLYESDEHEGIHYFTMRLVEGGNLGERLEKRRPALSLSKGPIRENIALLVKVCRTVHYAHQRGILHRDLKPSNILIDQHGEPHVADFGLAKSLDHETGFTYSSSILGSPNYMAPEQASSHGEPITTAADVYGLGAILYQVLTGRPPFQGRTALETIRQVVDTPPVPPRRVNPQVDPDLATICLKCLEKKPGDRYESAEDLARDLEHWLQGLAIRARPVGAMGSLRRWARRHPAVATLSSALAVAVIAVLIGIPVAAMRIREAQQEAVAHLRVSLLDQVRLLRLSKQTGVRGESIRLLRQAIALGGNTEFKDRARDALLAALAFTDMDFSVQATMSTPDPELSLLDPRFDRVATIVDRTNLVVRRLGERAELFRLSTGTSAVTQVERFSPDGRFLALRHVDGLSFWDTETRRHCFTTNGAERVFCFAKHAPQLFLEDTELGISVLELPSLQVARRFPGQALADAPLTGWRMLSVSPDGKWLAGARRGAAALELIEVESGQMRWRSKADGVEVTAVAWQMMNRRLIAANTDGTALFRRMEDGVVTSRLILGGPVHSLALDDSYTLLTTAGADQFVRLWDLLSYRQIFSVRCDARELCFDEGGLRIGTVQRGDRVGWLDLSRSSEYQEMVVAGSSTPIERCEFSPDGRLVAAVCPGQVDIRRLSDGRRAAAVPIERLPIFAFDPSGEGLVTSDSRGIAYRAMEEEQPNLIAMHAPRRLLGGQRWRSLAFSGDGQTFFAANAGSNMVYVFARPLTNCLAGLGPHPGVDALATTHDGRRVASASSTQRDVRVWDVASKTQLLSVAMGRQSRMSLSPDGQWLMVHGDRLDLVNIRTGQPSAPLPFSGGWPMTGAACFSQDGRVLAVIVDQFDIQLFDLGAGRALGRLSAPRETRMVALAFSHNGEHLAATTSAGRMRVWNLARIRRQLAEVNLDWENAPFPLAPRESVRPVPTVEIVDRNQ